MRLIYSCILYCITPLVLLRLLIRGIQSPAYLKRWRERFAYIPQNNQNPLWIHTVSVGEFRAIIPLIKKLRSSFPELTILITTTTPTGSEQVTNTFSKEEVLHYYTPYDLPGVVKRFLTRIKPRALVIMETELWPNLINYSSQIQTPILLANARMSERSANRYQKFIPSLIKQTIKKLSLIAVQTQADGDRLIKLGATNKQITIIGNIKFFLELDKQIEVGAAKIKQQLFADRPVWIAGSTRAGEELHILAAHKKILTQIPTAILILVPRHPERFTPVAKEIVESKLTILKRSDNKNCDEATEIFLGDSMGEMLTYYAMADVTFVGGTLVATGGQNPIEPAALAKPVLFGQHTFNFTEVTKQLLLAGAGKKVENSVQLATEVISLLQDKKRRDKMGQAGKELIEKNCGATEKLLNIIVNL